MPLHRLRHHAWRPPPAAISLNRDQPPGQLGRNNPAMRSSAAAQYSSDRVTEYFPILSHLSWSPHIRRTGLQAIHARNYLQGEHEMTKYWLAGAAAFAMMTSVAFAQGMSSESSTSTQSTTSPVPAVGSYNSSETQHSTDSNGNATDKSKTFHSGMNGSHATSSSTTVSPDGSEQSTYHEHQATAPDDGLAISKKSSTSTTTIDH
jgi:hypothetical protein